MPLVKDTAAVDTAAVEAATAAAAETSAADTSADVLEAAPAPEPVYETQADPAAKPLAAQTHTTAVSTHTQAAASQAAVMNELAESGFEGLGLDFNSFPSVVLKDGEFQIAGSSRSFDAKLGFDGIITRTRRKFACRVGGDEDGDVVFAYDRHEFDDTNTEVGTKVAEWRAAGLKPEVKEYIEAYVMVTAVHDQEKEQELVGELVIVSVSPTSCGRFSGYIATQQFKHKAHPDAYVTKFSRGEKVTSAKFPFYPWNFTFVSLT